MKANKHPEYKTEKRRLDETLQAIVKYIERLEHEDESSGADDWAKASLRKRKSDRTSDYRESYKNPYFGRIDFQPESTENPDVIYLGYKALDLGKYEVIDWRAPIGSLWTMKKGKEHSYDAPGGTIYGKLLLKRRITIEDGNLIEITDEFDDRPSSNKPKDFEYTSEEEILIEEIKKRGDPTLQDIVKTIQEPQNKIIRAPHNCVMLIHGVAGSGKTSIAIHRLAYLLYPANNTGILPHRSIIFCPNPIFLHYIEDLLPQLGEHDIQQTTFAQWVLEQMKLTNKYKIVDTNQDIFLDSTRDGNLIRNLWERSRLKGDLRIKKLLENYVEYYLKPPLLDSKRIPEEGFVFSGFDHELQLTFIFTANEILNAISKAFADGSDLPLNKIHGLALHNLRQLLQKKYELAFENKRKEIEEKIKTLKELDEAVQDPNKRTYIKNEIEFYENLKNKPNQKQKAVIYLLEALLEGRFNQLWKPINPVEAYYTLFASKDLLTKLGKNIFDERELRLLLTNRTRPDFIEMEDVAAILYLHTLVNEKLSVKYDHIVVDEIQDFSPLQVDILHSVSNGPSMTLVGDIAQSIHGYRGLSNWEELIKIFPSDLLRFETITQSYRSTQEIVKFANEVLRTVYDKTRMPLPQPFPRKGDLPTIVQVKNKNKLIDELINRIQIIRQKGYKNIAVITKTMKEAISLTEVLSARGIKTSVDPQKLQSEYKYLGGLIILPVIQAKGLEFESVIIYNASESEFNTHRGYDGRLIYVAITRALHELQIIYTDKLSDYLKKAKEFAHVIQV